jgi:hypothetical protein
MTSFIDVKIYFTNIFVECGMFFFSAIFSFFVFFGFFALANALRFRGWNDMAEWDYGVKNINNFRLKLHSSELSNYVVQEITNLMMRKQRGEISERDYIYGVKTACDKEYPSGREIHRKCLRLMDEF